LKLVVVSQHVALLLLEFGLQLKLLPSRTRIAEAVALLVKAMAAARDMRGPWNSIVIVIVFSGIVQGRVRNLEGFGHEPELALI